MIVLLNRLHDDLKLTEQCGKVAGKATSVLSLIRRHFKYIDCETFLILFSVRTRRFLTSSWIPCPTLVAASYRATIHSLPTTYWPSEMSGLNQLR